MAGGARTNTLSMIVLVLPLYGVLIEEERAPDGRRAPIRANGTSTGDWRALMRKDGADDSRTSVPSAPGSFKPLRDLPFFPIVAEKVDDPE